jgi:putative ABC transport system permease protein
MGEALKQAGLNATGSVAWKRYRNGLVIAEIALTLVLLTGAGLMIQSVSRLLAVNPGFDPENLVRVYLSLPGLKYDDPEPGATELRRSLYAQMHERLAALPGVKAVGIGKHGAWPEKLKIEGRDVQGEVLLDGCGVEESDLFRASRIPLRAGRYLDKSDLNEACGNVIINETMARRFWPGKEAVGKKFDGIVWRGQHGYQVVGVVGDLRDYSYDQTLRPTFYRPCQELQLTGQRPFLLIRTEHDPRHLIPAIRAELKAAEPEMRRPDIVVCRQVLYESTQAQRLYMLYLAVFAGMALLLSALGIYGVLAYSVARRTREIGIRMAIGAERRHVLGMVMREGARLVGLGMGVGLLAAFWLTRLLRNQLFEVSPTEPVVFLSMIFLLLAVGLLACFLPARRAGQVEPIVALRYE